MPVRSKKKKELKEQGYVFEATGKSVSEIHTEELVGKTVEFDAHDVTAKIMEFGKVLTGISLYSYQEDIAYGIIYSVITFSGDVKTVLLSRQSGKSEVMAFVIDTLCVILPALASIIPDLEQFKTGFRVGLFAPQSDQVVTTYSRSMTRLRSANADMVLTDPDIDVWLESVARLELSNGSFLAGQVASKQSKIESKTYDLVIVEEAQDVDNLIVSKSIEPMLSSTAGTLIKVGTTGMTKNHFYYEIKHNRELDRKCLDPRVRHHYEYDYKKIIASRREQYEKDGKRFHLNYEADIYRKRERWGEESQAFKLAYALIWDIESVIFLCSPVILQHLFSFSSRQPLRFGSFVLVSARFPVVGKTFIPAFRFHIEYLGTFFFRNEFVSNNRSGGFTQLVIKNLYKFIARLAGRFLGRTDTLFSYTTGISFYGNPLTFLILPPMFLYCYFCCHVYCQIYQF
jgi:hypothetical protein